MTLPLALVALVLAIRFVPAHVNETSDPVDNLGGILSAAARRRRRPRDQLRAGARRGHARARARRHRARGRRSRSSSASGAHAIPLYDLDIAARRIFWVAACAGIIVFGSLMGAMFIGQQFLQNVLGYSTLEAGAAILPAAVMMVIDRAALGEARRRQGRALHAAHRLRVLPARLPHDAAAVERRHRATGQVALGYALVGIGVGFAGTPASHSLTGSVPVHTRRHGVGHRRPPARPRRRDHAVDPRRAAHRRLRRRVRKAIAARRTASGDRQRAEPAHEVVLERRATCAQQYPQYAKQITAAAKPSFVDGQDWAYFAGIVAIVLGCRARVLHVPEARRRGSAARAVRRRRPDGAPCRAAARRRRVAQRSNRPRSRAVSTAGVRDDTPSLR